MSAFADFADIARWVAWHNEPRGPGQKLTKVPYGAGAKPAKADDPGTWLTRPAAAALAERIINGLGGGIGFELGDIGNDLYIIGLDLDSCISSEPRKIADWARSLIAATATYYEISPSGKGVKLFAYAASEDVRPFLDLIGVLADQWGCRRSVPGQDGADHGPAVEVYCARRYFAVTENRPSGAREQLAMLDWPVLQDLAALIPPARSNGANSGGQTGDNSRSAQAFREGARLRRGGKTFDEMCEALRRHPDPDIRDWTREKGEAYGGRELGRIWHRAADDFATEGVSLNDFYAYMPLHNYVFTPARAMWPAASINSRIPPVQIGVDTNGKPKFISASTWLDRNRPIEQMTWVPGEPMIIEDKLIIEGGWISRPKVGCLNLYLPPTIHPGDPRQAAPWIEHVKYVFPDDAEHIIDWLAHRVQHPADKINHALVLGGAQGIGKDTLLEPVKHAVGPWNCAEVSPTQILGRFTGFLKSVILRINEARDLGEFDRFKLYDHLKAYTASPPEVLRVDEKHLRETNVINCCGVIITTNHKTDGIFLPADDRRHHVAWSDLTKEDPRFEPAYWKQLWAWYARGGVEHVTAFLQQRDLGKFNAKAPPQKTAAFWAIVDAARAPEEAEAADVLDTLENPKALTLTRIQNHATGAFAEWLAERKNRRAIPHRLEQCGYVPVRNPDAKDGLWKILGRRQVIYARSELPVRDRISAARHVADGR
jgi:hypothetical protein